MKKINPKKYRDLFIETTGIKDNVVSTIDHVFGSPPLRVIDSHQRLMDIGNSTIFLWDITQPNIHKYRADLILDLGFYTSKNPKFFLYNSKDFYHKGKLLAPSFKLQLKLLNQVLNSDFLKLDNKQKEIYKQRAFQLIKIYDDNLKKHSDAPQFYKASLIDLYNLLGLNELAEYIAKKMVPLSKSRIVDKFLPELIIKTKDEPFGFPNIVANTDYLKKPYFRNISNKKIGFDASNKAQIIKNLNEIVNLLRNGSLLPKNQIYFWAWSLCGIKHFGNDYGILANLENSLKSIDVLNDASTLQLTQPKEDGLNFIQFNNIHSYSLGNPRSRSTKFNLLNTKSSRVTNICTVYLHSGKEGFQKYWREYRKTGKAIELDMLNVSL